MSSIGKTEEVVDVMERVDESEPSMFKVIFHNDDVTTVDVVLGILMAIFGKDEDEAMEITMNVHEKGQGIAGIYTHETAEQKTLESITVARSYGFPLEVSFEEE